MVGGTQLGQLLFVLEVADDPAESLALLVEEAEDPLAAKRALGVARHVAATRLPQELGPEQGDSIPSGACPQRVRLVET